MANPTSKQNKFCVASSFWSSYKKDIVITSNLKKQASDVKVGNPKWKTLDRWDSKIPHFPQVPNDKQPLWRPL